jgi:hypothetical protein
VDPTEDPNFRLPQRSLLSGSWTDLLPYLLHPSANCVTSLVVVTQDDIPLSCEHLINLPSCTKLQLRTAHPRDLTKFRLPKITSLALLACDNQDASFMDEVMKTTQKWITKPSKLFLGLQLGFNQWKMLLRILGEYAVSVQVAVPQNCSEGEKLHSFLNPTDELGRKQCIELLPSAKTIHCHIIEPMDYSSLAHRSAKETLDIPMKDEEGRRTIGEIQ